MWKKLTLEEFNAQLQAVHPHLEIVEEWGTGSNAMVKIHCHKCNQYYEKKRASIRNVKSNCPFCSSNHRKIAADINSLWVLKPELRQYIVDEEFAKIVGTASEKRIKTRCPLCGTEKELGIKDFVRRKYSCQKCGDKISYPNKFIRTLMGYLQVDKWQWEYKVYDNDNHYYYYDIWFALKNKEYVIEMDGLQHYRNSFKQDVADVQKNDNIKEELAKNKGFTLIRVNCEKSSFLWIKNNIENSLLNELFDLTQINWEKIGCEINKDIITEICEYTTQNPTIILKDIGKNFYISEDAVRTYLKRGSEVGIFNYSILEENKSKKLSECMIKNQLNKPYNAYDVNTCEFLGSYLTLNEGIKDLTERGYGKISQSGISQVLNNQINNHLGIVFFYIDDKNQNDSDIIRSHRDNRRIKMNVYLEESNELLYSFPSIASGGKKLETLYPDKNITYLEVKQTLQGKKEGVLKGLILKKIFD